MKVNQWYPSTTRRYRVPEGTIFVSVAVCDGTPFVQVFAGKVGTPLFALGAVNAALAGLALQQGVSYDEVLGVLDVTHEKSNGNGYDAKCLAGAIADSLEHYRQDH